MNKRKVILLIGTKRAGKTTAAVMLHQKYNWNYYEFDHFLDSLDLVIDEDSKKEKEFTFLESTIDFALEDANNYNINTVIVVWDFKPCELSRLKNINKINIYCLMPVHITEEILDDTIIKYSKEYDWSYSASKEDIDRNKKNILEERDLFLKECPKYEIKIIDTSFYDERIKNINEFVENINNY